MASRRSDLAMGRRLESSVDQRTGQREDKTVTTRVGVLCARVRVEEKLLLTTLAAAGFVAEQVFPAAAPLPIRPAPRPRFGPASRRRPGRAR